MAANSRKLTNEQLIEELKRVREILGKPPSKNEFLQYGKYTPAAYHIRKSWNEWIREVFGVIVAAPNKISDEELIDNLKEINQKIGRVPRKEDLKHGKYSQNSYRRAFKKFAYALVAAGFKPQQTRGLSKKQIIEELKEIYNKIGRVPYESDIIKHSKYMGSCSAIRNEFGSLHNAYVEAGIPVKNSKDITKEDVIKAILDWYNKNNKDILSVTYWKIRKAKKHGEFPFNTMIIYDKFEQKPWKEIMREIGIDYNIEDRFFKRNSFIGKDGNIYLSCVEKEAGDFLYKLKCDELIDYEYEKLVCNNKTWTCDFFITVGNNEYWVEVDGMKGSRSVPYNKGNKKIEYYKNNNYKYLIIKEDCLPKLRDFINV